MGFAALWIMLFHSSTIPIVGMKQIQSIGYAGVDIFFVLSGFGLYYAYKKEPGTGEFYRHRMARILPDYLLVLFFRTLYESHLDIHEITLSFIWHKMYFVLWYIPWILLLYLVTPVFIKFFRKNAIWATFAAVMISLLVSLAGTGRSSLYIGLARVPQLFLGFLLGKINDGSISVPRVKIHLLIPPTLIGYAVTIYLYNTFDRQTLAEHGLPWYPLLLSTIPMILLLAFIFNRERLGRRYLDNLWGHHQGINGVHRPDGPDGEAPEGRTGFLYYCGVNSLQIYLLHEFVLRLLLAYLPAPVLLSNIAAFGITLCGAGIYHKAMNYMKMRLHKLFCDKYLIARH